MPIKSNKRTKLHFSTLLKVTFISFFLTTLFTWPFLTKLNSFYSDSGDYPNVGWFLWHNSQSIISGSILNSSKFFSSNQFYPLPETFTFAEHFFFSTFIFTPIFLIAKNLVFSVNLFSFLTLSLSFITCFYAINYFLNDYLSGLIGAFVFTFNPLTFAHFPNHLQLINKYFLPLVFLCAYIYFKKPNWKNSFLFFLFFTLNALSVVYFQIFSIIIIPIFFLPFFITHLKNKDWGYFMQVIKTSLLGIFFAPFLLYINLPYLNFAKKSGAIRSLKDVIQFSARGIDWFTSVPNNLMYGKFVKGLENIRNSGGLNQNYSEHTLFTNVLPVFLFIFGIYLLINRSKSKRDNNGKTIFYSYGLIIIFTFIFSFGPFFLGLYGKSQSFKLPYYYLYKMFPLFDGIRVLTRFQFIFYIPFSLFTAYGTYFLIKKFNKLRIPIFLIIFLILIIENININNYSSTSKIVSVLNNYVSTNSKVISMLQNKNTVHLPDYSDISNPGSFANEAKYLTWSTYTGENIMNGYASYYPDDIRNLLLSLNDGLSTNKIKALKVLGINYVIFHKNSGLDLSKNYQLYKIGNVFEDRNILILDLNKYAYKISLCDYKKDLNYELTTSSELLYSQPIFFQLIIKNDKNCYWVNKFNDRYLETASLVDGKKYISYVNLPLVVYPGQKLSVYTNISNYKTHFDFLKIGNHNISINIKKLSIAKQFNLTIGKNNKWTSLNSTDLSYDVNNLDLKKIDDNILNIEFDVTNTGKAVWLGFTDEPLTTSPARGEIRASIDYYDNNGSIMTDTNLNTINRCLTYLNTIYGEKIDYICSFYMNKKIIDKISFIKLNLVDELISVFSKKSYEVFLQK